MTRSPEASVNARTASGLKPISQELLLVHLYWGLMAQKQLGNKIVSEATALPITVSKSHPDTPPKLCTADAASHQWG